MTVSRRDAADRIRRLAATLIELKDRVRRAVATETGKAVAEAVRDLLTAALGGTVCRDPYVPPAGYSPSYRSDDDPNRWDDADDSYEYRPSRPRGQTDGPHTSSPPRWPSVLALTAAAVKGWADRRLPGWAAAAVGVVAATAAVVGGPLLHAGLVMAGAAADLLPHAFPISY